MPFDRLNSTLSGMLLVSIEKFELTHGCQLVKSVSAYVALSRFGVSESELLQVLLHVSSYFYICVLILLYTAVYMLSVPLYTHIRSLLQLLSLNDLVLADVYEWWVLLYLNMCRHTLVYACFTGTKVQILTPQEEQVGPSSSHLAPHAFEKTSAGLSAVYAVTNKRRLQSTCLP
jgi:hypothetical protein